MDRRHSSAINGAVSGAAAVKTAKKIHFYTSFLINFKLKELIVDF